MPTGPDETRKPRDLNLFQRRLVNEFVEIHVEATMRDDKSRAYFDWASTFLENALSERGVNLFESDLTYFAVMAGIAIGTTYFEDLARDSADTRLPGEILRTALDQIKPVPLAREYTLKPEYNEYFERTSAFMTESINKFGLEVRDPTSFLLVQAGLDVSTEWMEGIHKEGRTLNEAGLIVRAGIALLKPPSFKN